MKKVVLPLVMLILGFVTGYLICKNQMSQSLISTNNEALIPNVFVVEEVKDRVDPKLAKILIQNFRNWNDSDNPNPFKTEGGKNLNGFFIPKTEIDAIFSGHQNAKGISIYIGEHPRHQGKKDHVYSFVFMRADTNLNVTKTSNTPYINSLDSYDYVKPCPDKCGDFAP